MMLTLIEEDLHIQMVLTVEVVILILMVIIIMVHQEEEVDKVIQVALLEEVVELMEVQLVVDL